MKKVIVFAIALFTLVASEYVLLTELFAQRRVPVMAGCFAVVLVCIFLFLRLFKKTVISS